MSYAVHPPGRLLGQRVFSRYQSVPQQDNYLHLKRQPPILVDILAVANVLEELKNSKQFNLIILLVKTDGVRRSRFKVRVLPFIKKCRNHYRLHIKIKFN